MCYIKQINPLTMSDLEALRELLPKYTITLIEKRFYAINAGFDGTCVLSIKKECIKIVKEIHDNCEHMLRFLLLNDFILQSDTKHHYVHRFLDIRVRINISTIYINDLPYDLIEDFYQIIRKKLNLDSLNKQVIGIDYIEDV